MNIDEHRLTWVLVGAIGLCGGAAHAGGPPEYEVTAIIEGFQCGDHLAAITVNALNDDGDVAGYTTCNLGQRAFRWTPETGLELIPMPAQTSESRARAIHGSKVVGYHVVSGNGFGHIGFVYDFETDEFTSLGTLPGGDWSEAHGINSAGEIVGFWGNTVMGPSPQAFIWGDGEMIDINGDFGTLKSEANDITDDRVVTGWMGTSRLTDARAFLWDNGKVTELPPLPDGITSEGWALNCRGDVAGRGQFFDPRLNNEVWRAFAFIDGEAINLGTLPGIERSLAIAINNDQTVVGFAQVPLLRAFVWKDGLLSDLNDLVSPSFNGEISAARGINQAGQIAADAHSDDLDATVGVLLSPLNQGVPGDLDGDGHVGASDLLILLASWGPCEECGACAADFDGNGVVGASDLLILLSNWG
ncbi:MAG: hypothetical protein V3T53_15420 [Phycisphaerales bacterium]